MGAVALGPAYMLKPFVNRAATWLAEVSYGLYLIHLVVGTFVGLALGLPRDGAPGTIALWFLVVLPLSLGYAYLSVRFVERPVRRWARRLGRRGPEPKVAAEPAPSRAGA